MVDLALTAEELAVVGAGNADDVRLTRSLSLRYPEDFPARIFEANGLDATAKRWRSLAGQDARSNRKELAIA